MSKLARLLAVAILLVQACMAWAIYSANETALHALENTQNNDKEVSLRFYEFEQKVDNINAAIFILSAAANESQAPAEARSLSRRIDSELSNLFHLRRKVETDVLRINADLAMLRKDVEDMAWKVKSLGRP